MKTAFHQCLQNFLRSQKVLGQTSFPLQESVLRTFLQNEQLVLAEKRREVAIAHPLEFQAKQVSLASGTVTSSPIEEPKKVAFTLPDGDKETRWKWLKQQVLSCPQCLQHVAPRKKLVFGSGNLQADLFFCGEAPGAEEEEQGEVFVGRAGQLLTKMIKAMGLRRSDVYIGNIMNWRPETPNHIGNRPPTQEEMQFCLPYLIGQVEIVQPKVIVALGATAVHGLLGYDPQRRMRDCRGHWFTFHQIPLLVTYHPSYLLRNATIAAKRMVWEDLLRVMQFLKLPISERQQSYFL